MSVLGNKSVVGWNSLEHIGNMSRSLSTGTWETLQGFEWIHVEVRWLTHWNKELKKRKAVPMV
jgi:hypothetical protein